MDFKEKYEQAIEIAKNIYGASECKDILCTLETIFPELKESKDEKIRKCLLSHFSRYQEDEIFLNCITMKQILAWLEKQGSEPDWCHHKVDLSECSEEYRKAYYDGWNNCNMQHKMQQKDEYELVAKMIEQKPTQKIAPFKAEHGKYYYCIKDYFGGGKKQASKGDVVQALRGLAIMSLEDASEYFLPVNFIKYNSVLGDDDEHRIDNLCHFLEEYGNQYYGHLTLQGTISWLKSLRPQK